MLAVMLNTNAFAQITDAQVQLTGLIVDGLLVWGVVSLGRWGWNVALDQVWLMRRGRKLRRLRDRRKLR